MVDRRKKRESLLNALYATEAISATNDKMTAMAEKASEVLRDAQSEPAKGTKAPVSKFMEQSSSAQTHGAKNSGCIHDKETKSMCEGDKITDMEAQHTDKQTTNHVGLVEAVAVQALGTRTIGVIQLLPHIRA